MMGEVILLLTVSILCDVFGQMAFKLGADRLPSPNSVGLQGFVLRLAAEPLLLGGLAIYALELIVWISRSRAGATRCRVPDRQP